MSELSLSMSLWSLSHIFVEAAQPGQPVDAVLADYQAKLAYARDGVELIFSHEEDRDRFVEKYLFVLIERG